ncbi:DEHA2F07392p [Debaryomyces hansenii CBS767]|uniref:DEHA2F07392p n=1 Tax=Debaryomyces hansenii (strain ATCC 36239 / CBS 767 / BCRC 21394 / JCM 1990 / NBRC 0083 / IGC 2968) TaxID=284592 RepID=Q6BM92_DEBHA|nr:DEHA2F07392p [Debaryomyces hansenii CBS767]CAG89016.2 DEHA2F07392p [Debaryomyces hansenii CBS767]|eukprot:XP_460679.2 DEHA2F07392p [Debaryomyces hansenii CBS767]
MSANNQPSLYPLQDAIAKFDCKPVNPNGKLSDVWLQNEYQKLSIISDQSGRESRKRIRNREETAGEGDAYDREGTESCDDMIISDTDCNSQISGQSAIISGISSFRENGLVHPPKRRLMSVPSPTNTVTPAVTETNNSNETLLQTNQIIQEHIIVQPRTPTAINSPTNTPISDIEEQSQQLPLPSPSASPVQSTGDKISNFDPIEHQLSNIPTTQSELMEMMVSLSGYLSEKNQNHFIFRLLQNTNRSSLSSFSGLIENSLKRDLISNLPLEITYNILSHLDYKALCSLARVCSNWYKIIDNSGIWAQLLKKDKLILSDGAIEREIADPQKLLKEWSSKSDINEANVMQTLYKKRCTILNRWMDPTYEPKRISVPGHGSHVVTCLQHDDEKIITGVDDKLINIYSTKTGELLKVLKGHEGGVWALKYTGNTLVSGSTDRTVRVWNIKTGKCTHVFRGHTSTVRCLDILHPVKIGKNDNGEDIIFPEVPLLVTGSRDHNLHVWKLPLMNEGEEAEDDVVGQQTYDSNEIENPYLITVLLGHTQSVRSVSGYGNIIVSGSYDTTVRVWDLLDNGNCKHVLAGHGDRIYSTALNFHTKRCYSGSMDSSINVWDIESGKLLHTLEGHSSLVGLLELSEEYLVSAAADSTLRVWNPKSGDNICKLEGHSGAITCFQHDSLKIVSGSEIMLKLWDINSGKFVRDLLDDITGCAWGLCFDNNICTAAVQRCRNDTDETFIEILDSSGP